MTRCVCILRRIRGGGRHSSLPVLSQAILVLAKAREAQARVLSRISHEQPDALRQEQQVGPLHSCI